MSDPNQHEAGEWTHSICALCWNIKNPNKLIEPTEYDKGEPDTCCYCGIRHTTGIYFREDSTKVHG